MDINRPESIFRPYERLDEVKDLQWKSNSGSSIKINFKMGNPDKKRSGSKF